ncbi:MAG: TIGR02452 family protein [Bacteroidales bacterium]|nr:TIGR02452 family protein [Bacteroidales bacterium]
MDITQLTWDAQSWTLRFTGAQKPYSHPVIKQLRQEVFFHTQQIVKAGRYQLQNGREVQLPLYERIAEESCFYKKKLPAVVRDHRYDMHVEVVARDCLAFANELLRQGVPEVCVLNMASATMPGGGVLNGSGAQEEYLFRCSDYYRSLYQYSGFGQMFDVPHAADSYPMHKQHGGIYTPNVTVFRDTEARGYALLEEPFHINCLAVAGVNHPKTVIMDGEERIADGALPTIYNKMHALFRIAAAHNQETLILGAWGCGAFGNPPRHMAELFKQTLAEPEFDGVFRNIYFAIKGGPNGGNFTPFKSILQP